MSVLHLLGGSRAHSFPVSLWSQSHDSSAEAALHFLDLSVEMPGISSFDKAILETKNKKVPSQRCDHMSNVDPNSPKFLSFLCCQAMYNGNQVVGIGAELAGPPPSLSPLVLSLLSFSCYESFGLARFTATLRTTL